MTTQWDFGGFINILWAFYQTKAPITLSTVLYNLLKVIVFSFIVTPFRLKNHLNRIFLVFQVSLVQPES